MTDIRLLKDFDMPAFKFMGLEALLDTGANKSVANFSASMFELIFAGKIRRKQKGVIHGFGGIAKGMEYVASDIDIDGIGFQNVAFFVPDQPQKRFKFIIAGTLFAKYPYRIDMINHSLTVEN